MDGAADAAAIPKRRQDEGNDRALCDGERSPYIESRVYE
jgi:hypothetical protein